MSATEPENTNSVIASATDDSAPAVDDGSLISPAASSAKKAMVEGTDATMSDDDNKVITTLETPKSTKEKIAGSHDSSGSIEIPADFILGSDIPATPAAAHATKEELEDHDLIAILEGDDVDITETATEIEVRVGGGDEGTYDGEQLLEEIHISIVDEQDLEAEKKEREREIAMRQMATLPTQPKGRKPKPMFTDGIQDVKTPTVKTSPVKRPAPKVEPVTVPAMIKAVPVQKVTTVAKPSLEIRSLPILPAKSPPGQVTIKGQTTIKPIPRPIIIKSEPTDSPSPTKKVMVPPVKPVVISKPLSQKPGPLMKPLPTKSSSSALPPKTASTSKTLTPKSSSSTQKANPPVPRPIPIPVAKKPNDDLISSLVSDWDDEPPIVLKKEPMSPVASPPVSQQPTTANITMGPPQPPTPEEPVKRSRVIKKKIIWDPDNPETHMSFASFVKSNRTKPLPETPPPKETFTPPPAPVRLPGTGGIRRKRAESVAVHMIKDTPQFALPPPRKRARTPEPVSSKARPPAPVAPKNTARKKKSEIEKLLGDEGAINMLYDVECENSNTDLLKTSDMKVDSDDEDEKLMAKAKIIADAVIKQGHSPNDNVTHVPRMRTKRAPTPQKQTSTSPSPVAPSTSSGPSRKSGGTTNGPGRKRKRPQSGSEDWDYVYNSRKTCDDAMIIRRRSNSSYSSSTSPRRLSVDQPNTSTTETSSVETPDKSNFEFIKPSNKSPSKLENIKLDSSLVANMKGKLSKVLASKPADISSSPTPPTKQEKKLKVSPTKAPSTESTTVVAAATLSPTITTSTATVRVEENGAGKSWESLLERLTEMKLQELSFKRCGNYVELTLAPKETKLKDVFTVELINELKTVLNILKSDPNVKAVLIRSSGKHFCRGIDVSYLIQTNAEKRKTAAQVYSGHLRNFLQSMATFSKPLVAAIHGDMVGLGVTMLPLFDVVIAQDSSTFQTPYGILGHLPEAMKIFTSTKNLKPRAITDLLYLCRKVSVNTALDYGLVSEVVNSEKIQDRADSITKKLASLSQQALKSMKANLRQELLVRLDDQLTMEQKKLSQQWITTECQEKFKQFINRGGEW
nr:flocculation protein FLO11 isoform X3 [Aedes albopictus]